MSKRDVGLAGCRRREVSGWVAGACGGSMGRDCRQGASWGPQCPGTWSQNYLSLPSSSLCKSLAGLLSCFSGCSAHPLPMRTVWDPS